MRGRRRHALFGAVCLALAGCATRLSAPVPATTGPPTSIVAAPIDRAGFLQRVPPPRLAPPSGRLQRPVAAPCCRSAVGCRPYPLDVPSAVAAAAMGGAGIGLLALADKPLLGDAADFGERAPLIAAVITSIAHRDKYGLLQLGASFGATMGLVQVLKRTTGKRRPDRRALDSFPSAHTAAAFSAAAYLDGRYGPRFGLPAYALAAFTALTRVRTKRHYLDDAIAGAGIGLITSWLFVRPYPVRTPWEGRSTLAPRPWRIAFAYRAVWGTDDRVRAPSAGGTRFNITRLDDPLRAVISSRVALEHRWGRRHALRFCLDPIDIVDTARLTVPLDFAGRRFAVGDAVDARQHYDKYCLGYRYGLTRRGPWRVEAGASLVVSDYFAELKGPQGKERVRTARVLGMPTLRVARRVLPRVDALLDVGGVAWGHTLYVDARAGLRWRVTREWDLGIGYRYLHSAFRETAISSSLAQDEAFLEIGRSF